MSDTQTEIVIIPHPNEQKKLADLQKRVLLAVQERADGELWMPCFPLYVRGFCGNDDDKFLTEGVVFATRNYESTEGFDDTLAVWRKRIVECTLAGVRDDGECIALAAEIATRTGTIAGTVTLARRLRTHGDTAQTTTDARAAVEFANDDTLPLRLPVFRVARVEFAQTGARTEWTVRESRWVKGQGATTERNIKGKNI